MISGRLTNEATLEAVELQGVVIIGRSTECNLCIPDGAVSRRHAMIRQEDDGFWFFDLGSFNGTYINGSRVTTQTKLISGDTIKISGHSWVYEDESDGKSPASEFFGASTMAQVSSIQAILLVTDIQGFSALSEKLDPDDLAPIIGSWYSQTEAIITRFGANLDKFIGDCAMAYWTDTTIENRILAIHAAGAMQQSCIDTYEQHRETFDRVGLRFGVGAALHLGRVAHGGMSAREFTLLGDAVNVAFRIEALTRPLKEPVLASDDFLKGWEKGPSYCRCLGEHAIKGRSQPVVVHAVDKMPGLPAGR